MVCTQFNPVVLFRGGETRLQRYIVLVCITKKTWILGDQGLVRFFRVSYDANHNNTLKEKYQKNKQDLEKAQEIRSQT
jgi:hypothetical protein